MDSTKVADLTVDEFKNVIRETVAQTLAELLGDPDEGLALREALSSELFAHLKEREAQYKTVQTVAKNLDLDW